LKILAVDTATRSCSVGLIHCSKPIVEIFIATGQTHSKHLPEQIRKVLEISGLRISDIDGFAVTKGPGSFTGLRIGISTIKGLVVAVQKPFVGISSLQTLAMQGAGTRSLICPLLDARKGEVYSSRYRFDGRQLVQERPESVSDPCSAVRGIAEPCLFIGDGAVLYKEMIEMEIGRYARFAPDCQNMIHAVTVALLAEKRFSAGDQIDVAGFTPSYIRRSDAEK